MDSIRLFLGTYADFDILEDDYTDLLENFKYSCFGKWVEPENLHFTYHFIGEVPFSTANNIKAALKDYLREYRSTLVFEGLGCFPDSRQPKVMHINIMNNDKMLQKIHKATEEILKRFGYKPENRPFHPHLTLVRIKDINHELFRQSFGKYKDYYFGEMDSFKVCLLESKLTPRGPVYKLF